METTKRRNTLIFIILTAGTFITAMTVTVTANMLPAIMQTFQISTDTAKWLTSGATLLSGISIPVAAYLIKRFPTKTYFLMAMAIFVVGATMGAIAPSFVILMIGRLIQAVGCGLLMPFTQVVLMAIYPKEKYGTIMGAFSMAVMFAPVAAPTIAGLVIDYFGWKTMFGALGVAGGIIFLLGLFFIANVSETYREKFPLLPVVLTSVGFSGILIGLGNLSGNSLFTLQTGGALLLGLVFMIAFVRMQLRAKEPFLNLRVFQQPKFTVSVALSMLMYLIAMGNASLLPIYAQSIMGHTATAYALATLPASIITAALTLLSGRLYDKFGGKPLFILGAIMFPLGAFVGIQLSQSSGLLQIGAVSLLISMGTAFVTTPSTTMGLSDLQGKNRIDGSSILNTLRQIASSLATTIAILVYSVVSSTRGDIFGVKVVYMCFLGFSAVVILIVLGFFVIKPRQERESINATKT